MKIAYLRRKKAITQIADSFLRREEKKNKKRQEFEEFVSPGTPSTQMAYTPGFILMEKFTVTALKNFPSLLF